MTRYEEMQYCLHYTKHCCYVVLAWKQIQNALINNNLITSDEFNKIDDLIIWHDNSTIESDEWIPYVNKFFGKDYDKECEEEFKEAVRRHKERNLQHYESLKDYKGDDWRCYIVEMICDYIAMGWEFNSYIFEYYEEVKSKIDLPLEYKEYLDAVLNVLKDPSLHSLEEPMTEEAEARLYYA